jgi:Fe-Mn family superoxide dismutase
MFKPKKYEHLLKTPGFSDDLLKNHFQLYEGYVKGANQLNELFLSMSKEGKLKSPEFAELKRRFSWEFNGIRLHEYYFENMSKEGSRLEKSSQFFLKISEDFGSYQNWEKEFMAMGAMRGIGWVILAYDPVSNHLFNCWINEHNLGFLAGTEILLVMDVFEHAFMIDYGVKREGYLEAFMKALHWTEVNNRYERQITLLEART